jgi:predicted house-cleaning noncanonical NTP pyrophosphatase (MazG superfamily)
MRKLVRDKIIEIIKDNGGKPVYRTIEGKEYINELLTKLEEEMRELMEVKDGDIENIKNEIADVQEIINNLLIALKISKIDLTTKQREKIKSTGGFKKKIFVETVSFEESNTKLIEYYRKKGWKEERV